MILDSPDVFLRAANFLYSFHVRTYVSYCSQTSSQTLSPNLRIRMPLTFLLTPWSRVLIENLTVNFAASQEIPSIYGTRNFLTVPTSARHLSMGADYFTFI
jgi:hypothetical protein